MDICRVCRFWRKSSEAASCNQTPAINFDTGPGRYTYSVRAVGSKLLRTKGALGQVRTTSAAVPLPTEHALTIASSLIKFARLMLCLETPYQFYLRSNKNHFLIMGTFCQVLI